MQAYLSTKEKDCRPCLQGIWRSHGAVHNGKSRNIQYVEYLSRISSGSCGETMVLPNNTCGKSMLLKVMSFPVSTSEGCGKFLKRIKNSYETIHALCKHTFYWNY